MHLIFIVKTIIQVLEDIMIYKKYEIVVTKKWTEHITGGLLMLDLSHSMTKQTKRLLKCYLSSLIKLLTAICMFHHVMAHTCFVAHQGRVTGYGR